MRLKSSNVLRFVSGKLYVNGKCCVAPPHGLFHGSGDVFHGLFRGIMKSSYVVLTNAFQSVFD